jgi:hypothetical protein
MLTKDAENYLQKNPEALELICKTWMEHYNFMLGLIGNSEVDTYYYQEHFNEFKWYDV